MGGLFVNIAFFSQSVIIIIIVKGNSLRADLICFYSDTDFVSDFIQKFRMRVF